MKDLAGAAKPRGWSTRRPCVRGMRGGRAFLVLILTATIASCTAERPSTSDDIGGGSALQQSGVGFYQDVSWAPDGSALTLSVMEQADTPEGFRYRVHRLTVDSPDIAALTAGPMDLWTAWAPDGNRIAFASRSGATSDIYVMQADGSGRTRLTDDPADDTQPDWSPDGTRIAFVSSREGTEQVYVMNADGSGQTRIGVAVRDAQNPVWSPDGERIAYYETDSTGDDEVYVMNSDGSGRRFVGKGLWPHWSPGGGQLLYGAPEGLTLAPVDGTGGVLLVAGVEYGVFSPDGARIAYIRTDDGQVSVSVSQADGSQPKRLVTRSAPEW